MAFDHDDDPTGWQMLTFYAVLFGTPAIVYGIGYLLGRPGVGSIIFPLFGGFFAAPAAAGWITRRGFNWWRVGLAARIICGVIGAILVVNGAIYIAGVDLFGMDTPNAPPARVAPRTVRR